MKHTVAAACDYSVVFPGMVTDIILTVALFTRGVNGNIITPVRETAYYLRKRLTYRAFAGVRIIYKTQIFQVFDPFDDIPGSVLRY